MEKINTKTQLQKAILLLESLIKNEEKAEAKYQEYLENNPIVFSILGYKNFYSFTKESGKALPRDNFTGLKPEPDFIVEKESGLFEVFEIKTPHSKRLRIDINKYRERFTAEVSSYISQTITYEQYFTRNPENRKRVKDQFGLDIQEDLDITIVIGLNENLDKIKVHQETRKLKYKIDILTYDDILDRLIKEYESHYAADENLSGFSFHFIVRFLKVNNNQRKYFLDIGQEAEKK